MGRKPDGYWRVLENCQRAADECSTRLEFRRKYPGAQGAAKDNKWLHQLFANHQNAGYSIKPMGYWTFERCKEKADECLTRKDYSEQHQSASVTAHKNGWINALFATHPNHGYSDDKPHNFKWDKAACQSEANQCETRSEFKEKISGAYNAARANGWIDELFADHDNQGFAGVPLGHWTMESCQAAADECETRKEFEERYAGAADAAYKNGWFADLFSDHLNDGRIQKPKGYRTKL